MSETPMIETPSSETLLLVDGHALVHRAFHAIPPLSTKSGEMVNAVFGFASMLLKALADLRPTYVVVAFDLPTPTFRHAEFEDYKATRPKMADDLRPQFDRVRELVAALGIPIFEIDGFEADDVLGTLARQGAERGLAVVIATGDADAMQLVGPSVSVMVPQRGFSETTLFDEAGVKAKYGVAPSQIPDYKALKGDVSDNISGVPGIGEKTAVKLLGEFGSLAALLERSAEAPAKLRSVLAEHAESARKSRYLATIVLDVPVTLDPETARVGQYDRGRAVELLRQLEFRTLVGKLPEPRNTVPSALPSAVSGEGAGAPVLPVAVDPAQPLQMGLFGELAGSPVSVAPARPHVAVTEGLGDYRTVDTPEALAELAEVLAARPGFVVDVESTAVDAMRAVLVGISVAAEPGIAYYIPVGHQAGQQLPLELVRSRLGPLLGDRRLGKSGHNLKYDMIVLERHGLPVRGVAFDTMLATYLLESSQRALSLKDVAFSKLGVEMTPITDLIGKSGKGQLTMDQVEIAAVAAYSGADADLTLRLMRQLEPELRQAGLWSLFTDVEMPLVPVLAEMEQTGVALDVPFLRQMSVDLAEKIGALEGDIYASAGHRLNINSTQQLAVVLFQELGLPPARRNKTGPSTDADTLEALRGAHPIIGLILDHRQLVKLRSTYVEALPALINPVTGRVHTSFNQTGTTTGRVSSSDPNLQNIPIRTEIGREVRRAFIAGSAGSSLLGADYSQIELRILAHITGDEQLVAAFAGGKDIHSATASQLFSVPLSEVTSSQRRIAKTTNFGVIYGISDYGLSQQLGIGRKEAADFIQSYFATYPAIRGYLDDAVRQARSQGYVTTLLGRRRFIADINASSQVVRNAAERMAINMPIQGTAADIIKVAMIRLAAELHRRGMSSQMVLQVHDELVLEGPDEELADLRALVVEVMEGATTLSVPLRVAVESGKNWRDLE